MPKESTGPSKPAEAEDPGVKQLAASAHAVFVQNAENLKEFLKVEAHRKKVGDAMEKNATAARNQEK